MAVRPGAAMVEMKRDARATASSVRHSSAEPPGIYLSSRDPNDRHCVRAISGLKHRRIPEPKERDRRPIFVHAALYVVGHIFEGELRVEGFVDLSLATAHLGDHICGCPIPGQ